ncbi:MAG TPA: TIGR02453 family protein [Cytophagales bacterium]|nr:TIGR02453 family protein [Cytophagales bacterium]HAA21404.1 TIGR02453 family protein [Cytophagales bacterium]HAP59344.1 TIGR02453 family protein [Cytophagales bacterium]
MFTAYTQQFLLDLQENNHREWFQAHKETYEASHREAIGFADALLTLMQEHDQIDTVSGKKSLQRIYRDTRFSKDKTPYKNYWGGGLRRSTAALRGGYYYHVQPGDSFVGGGFYGPNKEDLLHLRKHIEQDAEPLREVLESKTFKETFGVLRGEQVKSAPKGFAKDHPNIDLLRYKSYIVRHNVPDEIAFSADMPAYTNDIFQKIRPFFDVMSEYLTTDQNGISLL